MDCSTPGFPVHHQPPEPTQTYVHWVGDAIQPSHPLASPSPPAFNLSQHQGVFQWVSSSNRVTQGHLFIPSPGLSKHSLSADLSLKKELKIARTVWPWASYITSEPLRKDWVTASLGKDWSPTSIIMEQRTEARLAGSYLRSSLTTLLNLQFPPCIARYASPDLLFLLGTQHILCFTSLLCCWSPPAHSVSSLWIEIFASLVHCCIFRIQSSAWQVVDAQQIFVKLISKYFSLFFKRGLIPVLYSSNMNYFW